MNDASFDTPHQFLAQFLPKALQLCAENYQSCIQLSQGITAKDIKEYHSACKASVSHLAALLKLIDQWHKRDTAQAPPANATFQDMVAYTRHTLMHRSSHETTQAEF